MKLYLTKTDSKSNNKKNPLNLTDAYRLTNCRGINNGYH